MHQTLQYIQLKSLQAKYKIATAVVHERPKSTSTSRAFRKNHKSSVPRYSSLFCLPGRFQINKSNKNKQVRCQTTSQATDRRRQRATTRSSKAKSFCHRVQEAVFQQQGTISCKDAPGRRRDCQVSEQEEKYTEDIDADAGSRRRGIVQNLHHPRLKGCAEHLT